jgi:hypothetical protein
VEGFVAPVYKTALRVLKRRLQELCEDGAASRLSPAPNAEILSCTHNTSPFMCAYLVVDVKHRLEKETTEADTLTLKRVIYVIRYEVWDVATYNFTYRPV